MGYDTTKQVYENSINALRSAKVHKYIDALSPEDVYESKFGDIFDAATENKKPVNEAMQDYYALLANLNQSITTRGLFTYEIFDYLVKALSDIKTKYGNDTVIKFGKMLNKSITVFHKQYNFIDESYDFDNSIKKDSDTFLEKRIVYNLLYTQHTRAKQRYGKGEEFASSRYQEDAMEEEKKLFWDTKDFLNFDSKKKGEKNNINVLSKVNKNPEKPDRVDSPSFSAVLINDKNIRSGTKNHIELSAFLNLISNIEYSKAYPILNATFVLPSLSKQDVTNVFKTATLNQFMFGSNNNVTNNYHSFENNIVKNSGTVSNDKNKIGVETNLAVFMTPQTFINMNEKVGHRDVYNEDDKRLRITSVHDKTRPFMTLKSFTFDIAPTKELMTFKSGQIVLVLHDRTRMGDIAPFIKPDLFGAFGAEIAIEYGWAHPDAGKVNSKGNPINAIGDFMASSVCLEKYMVTNTQFSITPSGEVEINLAVAMKGPTDIRQSRILSSSSLKLTRARINVSNSAYNSAINELHLLDDELGNISYRFDFMGAVGVYSDVFNDKLVNRDSLNAEQKKLLKGLEKGVAESLATLDTATIVEKPKPASDSTANNKTKEIDRLSSIDSGGEIIFKGSIKSIKAALGIRKGLTSISGGKVKLKTNANVKDVFRSIKRIRERLVDLDQSYKEIKKVNKERRDEIDSYVNSIIGGISQHDMFSDNSFEVHNSNFNGASSLSDIVITGDINSDDYITFGSFLMSLIATHMLSLSKYDEIQFVFHNVNEFCGLCSMWINTSGEENSLSLASLLIRKDFLEEFLKECFEKSRKLSVEGLISNVISNFILSKDNPCYGLASLYEREKFNEPAQPLSKKLRMKRKIRDDDNVASRLNLFYYGKDNKVMYDKDPKFVPPSIRMSFDALSDVTDLNKTICRITVYDNNDNPHQSLSNIFNESINKNKENITELMRLSHQIKNSETTQDKKAKKAAKKEAAEKKEANINRAKILVNKLTGENGIFKKVEKDGKTFFSFNEGKGFLDIKEKSRTLMPTATFASNNTALLSANVATVNEGLLNTVYITRQDRNDTNELNKNVLVDMPLRVLPSQVSIETLGCPWFNFGQYVFLDFETGTTIDNTYVVTSVKHSLSPGKFSSTISLSYGDVYGKYESIADAFSQAIEAMPELIDLADNQTATKKAERKEIVNEKKAKEKTKSVRTSASSTSAVAVQKISKKDAKVIKREIKRKQKKAIKKTKDNVIAKKVVINEKNTIRLGNLYFGKGWSPDDGYQNQTKDLLNELFSINSTISPNNAASGSIWFSLLALETSESKNKILFFVANSDKNERFLRFSEKRTIYTPTYEQIDLFYNFENAINRSLKLSSSEFSQIIVASDLSSETLDEARFKKLDLLSPDPRKLLQEMPTQDDSMSHLVIDYLIPFDIFDLSVLEKNTGVEHYYKCYIPNKRLMSKLYYELTLSGGNPINCENVDLKPFETPDDLLTYCSERSYNNGQVFIKDVTGIGKIKEGNKKINNSNGSNYIIKIHYSKSGRRVNFEIGELKKDRQSKFIEEKLVLETLKNKLKEEETQFMLYKINYNRAKQIFEGAFLSRHDIFKSRFFELLLGKDISYDNVKESIDKSPLHLVEKTDVEKSVVEKTDAKKESLVTTKITVLPNTTHPEESPDADTLVTEQLNDSKNKKIANKKEKSQSGVDRVNSMNEKQLKIIFDKYKELTDPEDKLVPNLSIMHINLAVNKRQLGAFKTKDHLKAFYMVKEQRALRRLVPKEIKK